MRILKRSIVLVLVLIIIFLIISGLSKNGKTFSVVSEKTNYDKYTTEEYYGYLKIPSIEMNLGFYNYDDPLNDVEKNIKWIRIPVANSYLFAAHSGVGQKAYFNKLFDLEIGSDIYLKLPTEELHYEVINIYRTPKDGDIAISKEEGKIYLTTCDQIIKGYQLVIEGILS